MIKKIFVLLVILGINLSTFAQIIKTAKKARINLNIQEDSTSASSSEKELKDFKDVNWGMTVEQVLQLENKEAVEKDEQRLVFEDSVLDLDCLVSYFFLNDALGKVKYQVDSEGIQHNNCLNNFKRIKAHLIKKYGLPNKTLRNGNWLIWQIADTQIILRLTRYNIGTDLSVEFNKILGL